VSTPVRERRLDRRSAWCLFAVSAAAYVVLKLLLIPAHFGDVDVYRAEGLALREGMDLYGPLPGVHGLATYPPFAAALFVPWSLIPAVMAGELSLLVNIGLLLCACYLSLDRIAAARPEIQVAAPALAAVALWFEPVMLSNTFGQVNLAILCLVLWDFSLPASSRWKGTGIGLAAAIKVTPGIFIVHLVLTRQVRAARTALLTFVATVALSAVLVPTSTLAFWTDHVFDTTRVGRLENSVNQSVLGFIVRAGHTTEPGAWATVVAGVVLVLGLACAVRCHRRRQELSAILVVALTGLLVSPISWSHHWVWCVPLVALAWYETKVLLVPTLLIFGSYVVWWIPHGDGVELHLGRLDVGMSAWYSVYAVGCIIWLTVRAGAEPRTGPSRPTLLQRALR
jgi:alpha-1,2-mannosyltransferase